ncbi:MAG: hypothetical protein HKP48_08850 [Winogradskyella sp.]|nr:hypothetical protein [Winogradskyella sp.]MBT8245226.1 hypothetical protein [Winogradskyella sp.]NNK23378.1 hypothetical protein [Winogradskyella sp.]
MVGEFYLLGIPLKPRLMTEYAHQITRIVIGKITTIGRNVKIYQGVTLGSLVVKKELKK